MQFTDFAQPDGGDFGDVVVPGDLNTLAGTAIARRWLKESALGKALQVELGERGIGTLAKFLSVYAAVSLLYAAPANAVRGARHDRELLKLTPALTAVVGNYLSQVVAANAEERLYVYPLDLSGFTKLKGDEAVDLGEFLSTEVLEGQSLAIVFRERDCEALTYVTAPLTSEGRCDLKALSEKVERCGFKGRQIFVLTGKCVYDALRLTAAAPSQVEFIAPLDYVFSRNPDLEKKTFTRVIVKNPRERRFAFEVKYFVNRREPYTLNGVKGQLVAQYEYRRVNWLQELKRTAQKELQEYGSLSQETYGRLSNIVAAYHLYEDLSQLPDEEFLEQCLLVALRGTVKVFFTPLSDYPPLGFYIAENLLSCELFALLGFFFPNLHLEPERDPELCENLAQKLALSFVFAAFTAHCAEQTRLIAKDCREPLDNKDISDALLCRSDPELDIDPEMAEDRDMEAYCRFCHQAFKAKPQVVSVIKSVTVKRGN